MATLSQVTVIRDLQEELELGDRELQMLLRENGVLYYRDLEELEGEQYEDAVDFLIFKLREHLKHGREKR